MNIEKIGKPSMNIKMVILYSFLGTLSAILLIVFFTYIYFDIAFIKTKACETYAIEQLCFYDKSWDSGTYLSTITSFYSTIITILIAILGTFAFISFFSVRATAKQQVEETIQKESTLYFETDAFSKKLTTALQESSRTMEANAINRIDNIEAILEENEMMPYPTLKADNEEETQ